MRENPILFDLAQLLEAGIAPVEATTRLQTDPSNDRAALATLHSDLNRGYSFAVSLQRAGFASDLETEILKTAEQAGKLSEALPLVATRYERRRLRTGSLRMRLWFPNTVMFIALLVGAIRAVTAGTTVLSAIFQITAVALVIIIVTQLLVASTSRDASRWLSFGWRIGLHRSSDLFREFFELPFFTLFAWQADAGVDPVSGAKSLATLINAPDFRRAINRYRDEITQGSTIAAALAKAALVKPGELAEVINVGEQSGRLAQSLEHYLRAQEIQLEAVTKQIFAWTPRLYYFVIVLIAGATLI
ncbi:MAG: type II secretion system F family protein [Proteobacteria bacterium]|nr:type II secretion system F family protein [Pseudomonadota bacterium]